MPTVPRRGESYVQTAAHRFVQPGNAFQPAAPVDIGPAARQLEAVVERQAVHADEILLQEADNKLAETASSLHRTALQRRGKNAITAPDEVAEAWTQSVSEIEQTLTNDRQKEAFRARAAGRGLQLKNTVEGHTLAEMQRFDDQTTEAALRIAQNDAATNYQDPVLLAHQVAEAKDAIARYGDRNGWGTEAVKAKTQDVVSNIHSAVITRMLTAGDDLRASEYYKASKAEIKADDADHVEKQLEEGSLRGESQRQADKILGSKDISRADALEVAKSITDPKVRDATEDRINKHFSEQNAAARELGEKNLLAATNIVEQTGDWRQIPPAMWTTFSLQERSSLKAYNQKLEKGEKVETDWGLYYEIKTAASTDTGRDKFLQTNLLRYRNNLGDTEFKELVNLQAGLRKGDASAEDKADGYRTSTQIVDGALEAAGLDPAAKKSNDPQTQQVEQFRRAVDREVRRVQESTGKPIKNTEVQSIVDGLMVQGIVAGSGSGAYFSSPDTKRVYELSKGERIVLSIDNVPAEDRQAIAGALRDAGQEANDRNILRIYRKRIDRIITR